MSGCTKVSAGCQNCYAERMAKRLAGRYGYPKDDPFRVTLHPDRLEEPLFQWSKPQVVFVCSMGDLFHEDVPFEFIDEVFEYIAWCQKHTFLILTKRPERMKEWFDTIKARRPIPGQGVCTGGPPFCIGEPEHDASVGYCGAPWPLPNIWLGVTAENQKMADQRIPMLLQIPAVKRFVSVEPMLGEIDLEMYLQGWDIGVEVRTKTGWAHDPSCDGSCKNCPIPVPEEYLEQVQIDTPRLDWVICGGETGPGARPMQLEWPRSLRDQCVNADVPFFFKQHNKKGERLLDSREWNERPEV